LGRRFTPTGVGTTYWIQWPRSRKTVHPHGRGDNLWSVSPALPASGSPPRAWGQQSPRIGSTADPRFTPTGVGTTSRRYCEKSTPPVHPHGRGDNLGRPAQQSHVCRFTPTGVGTTGGRRLLGVGLPVHPHGRGDNSVTRQSAIFQRRFTPTGVGTTLFGVGILVGVAVHPHGRGDNDDLLAICIPGDGSPPRAWGQRTWRVGLR